MIKEWEVVGRKRSSMGCGVRFRREFFQNFLSQTRVAIGSLIPPFYSRGDWASSRISDTVIGPFYFTILFAI